MGLTPDERAIVANIARYHRKGPPDTTHPNFRDLTKEARGKVRGLAAILRLADALDREHKQKIESVRAAVDRSAGRVTLFLRGRRRPRARGVDRGQQGHAVARRVRSGRRDRQGRGYVTTSAPRPSGTGGAARPAHRSLLLVVPWLIAGCASSSVPDPHAAAQAYANAATRGDADALYAMMSTPAKQARSRDDVKRMIAEEHDELAQQGKELGRPDVRVEATARLRYADGEEAALELREGQYWVTAAGALPGGARTPEEALEQLRRVLARRSYAGLMRVLSPATRAAIENDLRAVVDGLSEPGTLPVKANGDAAVVSVPGGHQVKLKREGGVWRVEDFD